ncbi:MAG: hypothetical protein FWE95_07100 [Planctomycetaceae bacterium]|nr:hypothetical protein [Planctomycetaceae bacterium]
MPFKADGSRRSTAGRLVRYSTQGLPVASPWCQSAIADVAARRSATYLFITPA